MRAKALAGFLDRQIKKSHGVARLWIGTTESRFNVPASVSIDHVPLI